MGQIVYLTGAPATGKSTLTERLAELSDQITVFTYSKELARVASARVGLVSQSDMREQSAKLITCEDVGLVDAELIEMAARFKHKEGYLVIDSHAVTIESFGFRVTPFSKAMLHDLAPDVIVCLYADAQTLIDRIKADPAGRPLPPPSELDRHVSLQCQIASLYAFETGARLYYQDASKSGVEVLQDFLQVSRIAISDSSG
jgi:adenylate kinase